MPTADHYSNHSIAGGCLDWQHGETWAWCAQLQSCVTYVPSCNMQQDSSQHSTHSSVQRYATAALLAVRFTAVYIVA